MRAPVRWVRMARQGCRGYLHLHVASLPQLLFPLVLTPDLHLQCRRDSWRARGTHMAKLQAGLTARALRIDFGGLDLWDYDERRRNFPALDPRLMRRTRTQSNSNNMKGNRKAEDSIGPFLRPSDGSVRARA